MSHGNALIRDFVEGRYRSLETGDVIASPIRRIEILETTEGREAELIDGLGLGDAPAVVGDENTIEVLGERVARALNIPILKLVSPKASEETASQLADLSRHATGLIAVGSGTINDMCKYVAHNSGRRTAVFATAPSMNGYTTKTVSIDRNGFKLSVGSGAPVGVFYDLAVLADAPARLIRAGVGDAICRGTAQIDWLLSHNLLRTPYDETPFDLQLADERAFLSSASRVLERDLDAMAALVRILSLGGMGALAVGSSHPGSMGEHGISHYIDMFAKPHPGSLHGEQVGVATLTMARLHQRMLAKSDFPELGLLPVDQAAMAARYGDKLDGCLDAIATKNARIAKIGDLGQRLNGLWPRLKPALDQLMIDPDRIAGTLQSIGAATSAADIDLDPDFYRAAVRYTFEIRDRYSMLDLAVQAGEIDAFIEEELH